MPVLAGCCRDLLGSFQALADPRRSAPSDSRIRQSSWRQLVVELGQLTLLDRFDLDGLTRWLCSSSSSLALEARILSARPRRNFPARDSSSHTCVADLESISCGYRAPRLAILGPARSSFPVDQIARAAARSTCPPTRRPATRKRSPRRSPRRSAPLGISGRSKFSMIPQLDLGPHLDRWR